VARVIRASQPPARVIRADVFDAHVQGEQLVARAQDRAQRIEEEARDSGLQAGRAEAAVELIDAARARDAILAGATDEVLRVAAALAQHIVGKHVEAEPGRIAQLVAPQLMRVRGAKAVRVCVHPDDAPALRDALATAADGEPPAGLEVATDAAMARGGCLVQSDVGEVDARVETRLPALVQALRGSLP